MLFLFLCLNKQNVKLTISIQRIYMHFKMQNTTLKKQFSKTCETVLRLNMTSAIQI